MIFLAVIILFIATGNACGMQKPSEEEIVKYQQDGTLDERIENAIKIGNHKMEDGLVNHEPLVLIKFTVGRQAFTVNGTEFSMDAVPYIKNSRVYIPLSYGVLAMGLKQKDIVIDNASKQVIIQNAGNKIIFHLDRPDFMVGNSSNRMDVLPEIITPGRLMLPVRYLAEAMGANVSWDGETQSVKLTK